MNPYQLLPCAGLGLHIYLYYLHKRETYQIWQETEFKILAKCPVYSAELLHPHLRCSDVQVVINWGVLTRQHHHLLKSCTPARGGSSQRDIQPHRGRRQKIPGLEAGSVIKWSESAKEKEGRRDPRKLYSQGWGCDPQRKTSTATSPFT